MLRILIPWRGIGSILTSASKIFLLKSQLHSFSSLLILVSHKLRKRGIIVPAAAPQKHREQQAASNGRHLLRFGLPSRALAIPFADTRSQDHARQTKLFWGVCGNSFKLAKGDGKNRKMRMCSGIPFRYPAHLWEEGQRSCTSL